MTFKIRPKRSNVASKVPVAGDLDIGELAINMADQKIYTKTPSNAIVELGGGSGGTIDLSAVDQDIIPDGDLTRSLGSPTHQWADLYVGNATIYLNNVPLGLDGDLQLTFNGNVIANSDGAVIVDWADITGKPALFSGSYNDLTSKPTLFTANQSLNTGNSVSFNRVAITGASGIEGGEIELAKAPSSTLDGNVIIDVYENKLRFFEGGGSGRGFYLDLTTGANNSSTNIMSGGGNPFDQDLNTTDDVTFNSLALGTNITSNGLEIYTNPESGGSIDLYTDWTGNGTSGGLDLWLLHGDGIYLKTDDGNWEWKFDDTGKLRLPAGGDIVDSAGNSVLGGGGTPGADGASAYDIAVANGFVGSEPAWLASLQGEPGADGQDGAPGQGVPAGGTAGQVLAKIDGDDYNTEWVTPSGGSGATTLSGLTDVALEEPSQGQVLTWNNNQSKWENQGLPSINEITSYNADTSSIYSVSVGTDGVVTMTTARGGLEFGALPEPGGPTHFHIMRPTGENGSGGTDLYFGDDYNYVLQRPAAYGDYPAYGVEIGSHDNAGGGQHVWRFGTDGLLTFPRNGDPETTTDPILTIKGGEFPEISSIVSEQTGPADLAIVANNLNISGYNGYKVRVNADDGDISFDNNGSVSANVALVLSTNQMGSPFNWTFSSTGDLSLPAGGDILDSTGNSVLGGGGGPSGVIPIDTVAPTSPDDGQLWYDSTDGRTYIYFDSSWVDAAPAGGNANTGDITFDGVQIIGAETVRGGGSIELVPSNDYYGAGQYLNIYPTNAQDAPHIHVDAGTGGDLILGNDNFNVDVNHNGDISITAYDSADSSSYQWRFNNDGKLQLPTNGIIQQNGSYTRTTTPGINGATTNGVVWTSLYNDISSVKLTIQLETNEVGDTTGWHTQICEAIIASRGSVIGGDPIMTVYGVTYTSTVPLVTFTVQRNPTTQRIEVVATRTAATVEGISFRINSVEMKTRD